MDSDERVADQPREIAQRRAVLAGIGGLTAGVLLGRRAVGGPLNPPAGPIGPTGKELSQVEPRIAVDSDNTPGDANVLFRISQPGSYYLTSNIVAAGGTGVLIAADGVTLDLMGFAIQGANIGVSSSRAMITVRSGSIFQCGNQGVQLTGFRSAVEELRVWDNLEGIIVGDHAGVRDCAVWAHGGTGITAGAYSRIERCALRENDTNGISAGANTTVSDCNSAAGAGEGMAVGDQSIVMRCKVYLYGSGGIRCGSRCIVQDNICDSNGSQPDTGGIISGIESVIDGNICVQNIFGICAGGRSRVVNNVCHRNSGDGICAGEGSHVDGNDCFGNGRGIRVSTGSFVSRNRCSGNTILNWEIAAGSRALVVASAVAGAIAGDFGGVSPGSVDPNANYTY